MVTIKDVAKEAGVSVGTVSNVINNIQVKPSTRIKVEEAIKKLNYEPNIYARGFKMNRTNTIAVILPTIWNPFFSELAYNIEKCLRKVGMKMILCNSNEDNKAEIEYISMAKQNKMDGIIAITYSDIDEYVSENIPFVSIDRYFSKNITYVSSNNFEGGRIAAKKLDELGCKKIAYIGRGSKINNATRKRKDGFISYCKEYNIDYEICELLGSTEEFDKLLDKFIESNFEDDIKIQGVFAVTDEYAVDFIKKLNKYNIKIPKDVQVIGFDGSKSSAKDTIEISTIRQPVELIAEEAVKALINIIENNKVKKEIILPVKFIEGYTTKK
ncbi:LacI family DNA-binding transcriptional regulator [Clostridium celatum]|uniref:Transcriptional regulator, LacI family n=1 Tax=Clostridium celatum DSM 1785 TaxID=545697 RepID=L1QC01_9CLOT|nr:LacI family DNA-binding transcriptional regulator [Clostridium celatum]EKY25476.1 transcriptional regulator, LacI family [Clostridium celatum DSM 1785]MCE9656057.1 LacI family DNA-binding transcriptional regulator [Clostridium celatum]MDY3362217.1 LacI family DNA-binding transcriptional regulator [Clostridium celatum]